MPRPKVESELSFQRRLTTAMRQKGWMVMHVPERWVQESSAIGYPDIEAIHVCGRIITAELKTDSRTSNARPPQEFWLKAKKNYNRETYLWRPHMWNTIMRRITCKCNAPFPKWWPKESRHR